MNALIIEDEARAASHLERLLRKVAPEIKVLNVIESVRDSMNYLSNHQSPDIIFSDVQLADGLCFDIYKRVKINCPVIFTTAYDHYAIEAFETNGIDYLLKPVEEERLEKALDKVKRFSTIPTLDNILALAQAHSQRNYKSRFMVRIADKIKTIPTDEITTFYVLGKGTWLHTKDNRNYSIDFPLDELEETLDPSKYFRINRKYIVSTGACNNITAWSNSRLKLKIDGIDDNDIIVAREKVKEFKDWLDK
ncbi:MAG TPA: LytTR family DNA-binding domain-containing protein [Lentimicrobium sp.]|nr:LytTR family DNA-binding domain-containing protein [Lentimicrobium sp.]